MGGNVFLAVKNPSKKKEILTILVIIQLTH